MILKNKGFKVRSIKKQKFTKWVKVTYKLNYFKYTLRGYGCGIYGPEQRFAWAQKVEQCMEQKLQSDSFTATLPESELQRWLEWAEWIARHFHLHRSSSAVEERNEIYHNGRGLTEKRLRALTVIHNYGLKRADGTTVAMHLFGQEFPDLFS